MKLFGQEPAAIVGAIMACIAVAVAFGVNVSSEQAETIQKAIMAVLPIVGGFWARSLVIPTSKVQASVGYDATRDIIAYDAKTDPDARKDPEGFGSINPILVCAIVLASVTGFGCAKKFPPGTSPEAKIAVYADRFLADVEKGQAELIRLSDTKAFGEDSRKIVTPAIETTVEIGKRGKELADILDAVDKVTAVAERQPLIAKADAVLTSIAGLMTSSLVNVGTPEARERVKTFIDSIGASYRRILMAIGPYLPASQPQLIMEKEGA